ncbi:hypothetical protein [Streptomyces sp. NPDC016845]|uniref:hypothetical protein n=1 Tax=Streptomyces sp. NPDC016845 TaxID=3364972 RepID=UPI0037AFBBB7
MSDLGSQVWGMAKSYRFAVHSPEELWAMVEPADGATAADLGVLLTSAAKTIKEIGGDLKTHSTSVEWEGEGADAFHKWVDHAARATLSLGDYSESAGKWLGHAADTLHEVKPQLETLKNSSASARSILDAHDAKTTDVGNHDGGPSASSVKTAKSQYDNDRAEASQLMTKLAQSYSASTEQIEALRTPEFPALPEQFVPLVRDRHGAKDVSSSSGDPSNTGTAAAVGGVGVAAAGAVALKEAAHGASLADGHHPSTSASHISRPTPDLPFGGTGTSLDRAGTLPAPATPTTAPSSPAPSSTPSLGGTSALSTPPSGTPPLLGGAGRSVASPRGPGSGRFPSSPGVRGPLGVPEGTGTPGAPGTARGVTPGRGVPAVERPGMPGVQGGTPSPVRGPGGGSPGRATNGIAGGRPTSPQTGRGASAMSQGTVVGGSPYQQGVGARGGVPEGSGRTGATPGRGTPGAGTGRGTSGSGGRVSALSGGVVGGQPQQNSRVRRASTATTRAASGARGVAVNRSDAQMQHGGEPAHGSSPKTRKDEGRRASEERPRDERPEHEDVEVEQPERDVPELRLPGLPPTARRDNKG